MTTIQASPGVARGVPASLSNEAANSSVSTGLRLNGQAVIATIAIVLALATASECRSITHLPSLMYGVVLWGWWGCTASALWGLGHRIPAASSFSLRTLAIHTLAAAALGLTHLLALGSLGFTVATWRTHGTALSVWTSLFDLNRFGIELLLYGFVFGMTSIVHFQIRAQRDAMKALELQRQLSAAHLQALQMQLEPHFLFNTLNAITTLVELGRQKEAASMLSHLNVLLKSTLQTTTPEKVPLSRELEIMENYLAIEQVRFADRLRVEIKVDPGALDSLVPCFLLQPIVENAIRHGIAQCESSGLVEASARREGSSLHLRVRDSGPGSGVGSPAPQNGHGIGLKNTRQRLTHFYRDAYVMNAQRLDTGGFEVAIRIPYEHD